MPSLVTDETVFFEVATMTLPEDEPFIVVRIDTRERVDGGVPATVVSKHRDRDEAEREAVRLAGRMS